MILTDAQHATLEEKFSATQAKHDMEKENKRRLGVSQRMHDLLNATGLLEGKSLTHEFLADLIKCVGQIQHLQPLMLPRILGTYRGPGKESPSGERLWAWGCRQRAGPTS